MGELFGIEKPAEQLWDAGVRRLALRFWDHCNEIVMMEGSEPIKSNTQVTR
jgi:hypothetical protein